MKIISLILFLTFFYGYSQNENKDYVQNIADDACDCIAQINTETDTKNEAIKNCIASSIVSNLKTDVNKTEKDIFIFYKNKFKC